MRQEVDAMRKTSTRAIGIDNEHVSANDYKREREGLVLVKKCVFIQIIIVLCLSL